MMKVPQCPATAVPSNHVRGIPNLPVSGPFLKCQVTGYLGFQQPSSRSEEIQKGKASDANLAPSISNLIFFPAISARESKLCKPL